MNRWRAQYGGIYYIVSDLSKTERYHEDYAPIDDALYQSGNYFETKEEADAVAAKFRAIIDEHLKQKGGEQ